MENPRHSKLRQELPIAMDVSDEVLKWEEDHANAWNADENQYEDVLELDNPTNDQIFHHLDSPFLKKLNSLLREVDTITSPMDSNEEADILNIDNNSLIHFPRTLPDFNLHATPTDTSSRQQSTDPGERRSEVAPKTIKHKVSNVDTRLEHSISTKAYNTSFHESSQTVIATQPQKGGGSRGSN